MLQMRNAIVCDRHHGGDEYCYDVDGDNQYMVENQRSSDSDRRTNGGSLFSESVYIYQSRCCYKCVYIVVGHIGFGKVAVETSHVAAACGGLSYGLVCCGVLINDWLGKDDTKSDDDVLT